METERDIFNLKMGLQLEDILKWKGIFDTPITMNERRIENGKI